MRNPRILLTGAGSGIGFSLARTLRSYQDVGEVLLANVVDEYPARALARRFLRTPDFYFARTATADEYSAAVLDIVSSHGIELLITGSIFELPVLARLAPRLRTLGCLALVEDVETVDVFSDKLETINTLRRLSVPCPHTEEIRTEHGESILPDLPLPFLIKPRFGYASKGVAIIADADAFRAWDQRKAARYAPYVAQEYLGGEGEEYSGTITARADGAIKDCMAINRLKTSGVTMAARYDEGCAAVEEQFVAYGAALRPRYCLNIQCRLRGGRAYVFEINPRFGAAESIRREFGLDTLHSVLSEYAEVRQARTIPRRFGTVYREYDEVFIGRSGDSQP